MVCEPTADALQFCFSIGIAGLWLLCCSFWGMELFEEALRRWEQALTFRNRQAEDEACGSIKLGAGDAIAEESVDVSVRASSRMLTQTCVWCSFCVAFTSTVSSLLECFLLHFFLLSQLNVRTAMY